MVKIKLKIKTNGRKVKSIKVRLKKPKKQRRVNPRHLA